MNVEVGHETKGKPEHAGKDRLRRHWPLGWDFWRHRQGVCPTRRIRFARLEFSGAVVDSRRQRQGEPLIGMPADNASEAEAHFDEGDSEAVTSTPAPVQTGLLIYDPMTGDYRLNDT